MSASDYQNIYSPYEIILYHNNLPAINVHFIILSFRAEGRRGWKDRAWGSSLFRHRIRICEKISAPTMQSPYLRHSNKKHYRNQWLSVEGDRGWGMEPKIFFLSKLISVPCTAECIDVNQMIMLTS
jgi:hypothetical protein